MPTLQDIAANIAGSFGIPTNIFASLVSTESAWNPNAVGTSGEVGLTQLMPNIQQKYGVTSPTDPTQNLVGGAQYLSDLYKKYGDWTSALSAYNSGSPNSPAGLAYANKVLGTANSSSPGGTPSTSSGGSGTTSPSGWVYAGAIGLIILLVIFGIYGVVKNPSLA